MITDDEWNEIENRLGSPYGSVRMCVDGYVLHLEVRQIKPLKFVIFPFVDGFHKGAWLLQGKDGAWREEARRFLQLKKRPLFPPATLKRARIRKSVAKELGMLKSIEHRSPYWTSFAALKRHLIANNQDLHLVSMEYRL